MRAIKLKGKSLSDDESSIQKIIEANLNGDDSP